VDHLRAEAQSIEVVHGSHSQNEVGHSHGTEQETSDEVDPDSESGVESAPVDIGLESRVDLHYAISYADLHVMVTQDGRPFRVYLPCVTREETIRRMVEIDSLLLGGATATFRSDAFPILEISSEGPGSFSNPDDGVGSGGNCGSNDCKGSVVGYSR
jgi:hypothetical protein